MIFAPVVRRAAYATRLPMSDLALQRFLRAALARPAAAPGCSAAQDEKAITLQLDVPGLAREQLDITIDGAVVRVRSVDGAPRQVQRAWELPEAIDAAASGAKLEHGVLTLTLAKLAPVNRATHLTIQ
ncbi:molecular chaperone [Rhodococcus sp. SRB_17]|uniref:Hsp20/alpha crystallin family protein n=1 Tax=Acidovorax sp. SRB_24 TaxID=1962700 RepID=UPI00145DF857|nr:Hsp20/alpha crystallin family protein [Acidovorax sp. SRB_24]NMM78586.1 molecular chaperone [Acidovorax sp. SRB_24]NMM78906.1 molecular chaperone [Acidovorax sp. SRB_24]NMM91565.1 molecular chaperone [Rhodococcus sp. SRB_17]